MTTTSQQQLLFFSQTLWRRWQLGVTGLKMFFFFFLNKNNYSEYNWLHLCDSFFGDKGMFFKFKLQNKNIIPLKFCVAICDITCRCEWHLGLQLWQVSTHSFAIRWCQALSPCRETLNAAPSGQRQSPQGVTLNNRRTKSKLLRMRFLSLILIYGCSNYNWKIVWW